MREERPQQNVDDSARGKISQALGTLGAVGAALSYLLVYVFRLGEAMRFRFDPSLITVSINDFLTVLIPTAACVTYFALVSLLVRDLGDESRAKRTVGVHLSRPKALAASLALTVLPICLALLIGSVQASMWVSLVIAALVATGALCLVMRHALHVSPIAWVSGVLSRGSRGLDRAPSRMGGVFGVAAVAMLALFLFAGYTNQLDLSGSHTLVLEDVASGQDYAVLALFDGNRAVVRSAAPADGSGAYEVDLSEPYRVVYVTDGYVVTTASGVGVTDGA